jgi:tripartite-type tricarboxylate transporter receptor subunit TctC
VVEITSHLLNQETQLNESNFAIDGHCPTARQPHQRRATALTLLTSAVAGAILAVAPAASAQDYPSKTLTFFVPFAAGSATDQLARGLGQAVTEQTKQPVVVDNRAGASGMIAAQAVARAPADGHTVLITTNTTHAANEHLYKKLPYDPVKDFAPVTGLGKGGQVMVVNVQSPYQSVGDLLAAARKTPGKLTFGSGSSSSRVAGEMLKQLSGTDILHVPYKSNPLGITDLLGGQIDFMITDVSTGIPQIKAGKLRPLGYSTQKRSSQLPEVPTIEEAGVKGYDMGYWFAAYVPDATPAPVVARLNELLANAVRSPALKTFFESSGSEPWTTTPDELARFQAAETQKWGKVIKGAGIEPE